MDKTGNNKIDTAYEQFVLDCRRAYDSLCAVINHELPDAEGEKFLDDLDEMIRDEPGIVFTTY